MLKKTSNAGGNWITADSIRGTPVGSNDQQLYTNLANAEVSATTIDPTATGFNITGLEASMQYLYCAIRRPNKPVTDPTKVFNAIDINDG